jgi:nicotinate-nucleotide pyrophosphorylase (carboxylating)
MKEIIQENVRSALLEDLGDGDRDGDGDITALLISANQQSRAQLVSRESAIICGIAWFQEVFCQLDPTVSIVWHDDIKDGASIVAGQIVCSLQGSTRSLLTGERTALNFLQTLSGTASTTHRYVQQLVGSKTTLLDTRKTLPGLRVAQKYAVKCGGGYNHRMGLYDAFLIKENHIMACGSISAAVALARQQCPGKFIEVEVENLVELQEALAANVTRIMLDNFDFANLKQAVQINQGRAELEVSGNIDQQSLSHLSEIGVDYISVGALTKHVQAIDFSMRLLE